MKQAEDGQVLPEGLRSVRAILELVEAASLWLTLPDRQGGIHGAQANLDVLKRVLNGRIAPP